MALVTDYSSLQAHIADTLNRSDLTGVIPNFIQQFEEWAITDGRAKRLVEQAAFSISADSIALPTGLIELDSWYHDGATYYGAIEIVDPSGLAQIKAAYGLTQTGVPAFASIVNGRARFAPAPDATYSTKMTYWESIEELSDSNTSNWLLDSHSNIYLYGALLESAPYLKDDPRTQIWGSELEKRLNALEQYNTNLRFGGAVRRSLPRPIG
jgi:hypothetical protein